MPEQFQRVVYVFRNYFWDFYNAQKLEVQGKIDWVLGLVRELRIIPERFFKHLEGTDALYELRVKVGSDIYRIFCFFDEGNLIVLLHGFQKKSEKTPRNEIERAERLRKEYYNEKAKS